MRCKCISKYWRHFCSKVDTWKCGYGWQTESHCGLSYVKQAMVFARSVKLMFVLWCNKDEY